MIEESPADLALRLSGEIADLRAELTEARVALAAAREGRLWPRPGRCETCAAALKQSLEQTDYA